MTPTIKAFLHEPSSTYSYVVSDPQSRRAAVIDPALDFDSNSGRSDTATADHLIRYIKDHDLAVDWILETHAHADHISAAPHIRQQLGGRIAIGRGICEVQQRFKQLFNLEPEFPVDGSQFDHLFADNDTFRIGTLQARVIATPGHTSDSLSYLIGDAVFVGDSLFMPDGGTARCDFPGGDAHTLYRSIQRLFELPDATRVFVCHDYQPDDREPRCQSTIGEQRRDNIHVGAGTSEQAFVAMREQRDQALPMPTLILPAIQVNIRAGHWPPAESNGTHYLKLPVNRF
jgi:glyoxylase-like metal-dependent hydrolase (beta-lactamase superfamily II)